MREIKFKFEFILLTVLVPGCKGNYVPLGFQSQPTATHAPVELLAARVLPAKNKLSSISVAHPGTPINVMQPRSGEDPKLQNTLKNASY